MRIGLPDVGSAGGGKSGCRGIRPHLHGRLEDDPPELGEQVANLLFAAVDPRSVGSVVDGPGDIAGEPLEPRLQLLPKRLLGNLAGFHAVSPVQASPTSQLTTARRNRQTQRREDTGRGIIEAKIHGFDEPLRLLRAVGIFGHNASGKSTVILAARALHVFVERSSRQSTPGARIPMYEPFMLSSGTPAGSVELGCDVVLDNRLIRYLVRFTADTIDYEGLIVLNTEDDGVLIERHGSEKVSGTLVDASEANRLYVKEIQPNVLVLSKLAHLGPAKGDDSVLPYYRAILASTHSDDYSASAAMSDRIGDDGRERFADDEKYRNWIMQNLIAKSDIGIDDVHVDRVDANYPPFIRKFAAEQSDLKLPDKRVAVSFVHLGETSQQLPFGHESAGTKKLFNISGDWWRIFNEDITLFADELGASLHPRLMDALVRAVNDAPVTVRSQLIFATHETGLMEGLDGRPPALRRDQIYFTRKNDKGDSELYSLTEFKENARPAHNIRKRYMSGLYGAVPSLGELSP